MSSSTSGSKIPEERYGRSSFRLLLQLAAGVVATVGLANLAAAVLLESRSPNRAHFLVREKWKMLEALEGESLNLVLGDSTCSQGVVPHIIESELGGSWVNLCTVGNLGLLDDAWMLDRHIERKGPPLRVLLVHAYDVWPRDLDIRALATIPEPWGFWSRRRPALQISLLDLGRLLIARYAPLYSADQSLRVLARNPSSLLHASYRLDERGFLSGNRSSLDYVRSDASRYLANLEGIQQAISPTNRDALERMVGLADEHGFDVHIAHGPVWEEVTESPLFKSHGSRLSAALGRVTAQSPHAHILLDGPVSVPGADLGNVDHVTLGGAHRYTRQLVQGLLESTLNTEAARIPHSGPDRI